MQYTHYFFENENPDYRTLLPTFSSWAVELGRSLVDFFGGYTVDCDCTENPTIYKKRAKSNQQNAPAHGKAYQNLQDRILRITPMTITR